MSNIPPGEIRRAEEMLTPEQRIQSLARYEVMKDQSSFEKAGISPEQVQNAANIASEAALVEHRKLVNQNPWKATSDILTGAIANLEPDDKLLVETMVKSGSDFPYTWKETTDSWRSIRPNDSFSDTIVKIGQYGGAPTFMEEDDRYTKMYPTLVIGRPLTGSALGLPESDPRRKAVIKPSPEGIRSIFAAFGAEVPTVGDKLGNGKLIKTTLPGVFLTTKNNDTGNPLLSVNFSPAVVEQIITLPQESK